MSNERDTVRPDGVQATITDSGHIILEFNHDRIPSIELSSHGANQVGSYLNSAANRVIDERRLNDE